MADRLEDRVRDYLANHLELIGEGLSLIRKEHILPNPSGAGGKIDILARDKYGIFVIIEIKRSDQAARQTLNEIHKYTALLRVQHGLDETQVRVVIVSTDWNELRLPLSECVEVFPYSVEPIMITATPEGVVTSVEQVSLLPKSGLIRLSRVQGVYCFQDEKARDGALVSLISAAKDATIKDSVILKLNYTGKSRAVCFPFALYFLFSSPLLSAASGEVEQLKAQIDWDDQLDQPEENFLIAVNESFVGKSDEFEMSYPEKLTTILTDWKIVEILRFGRLAEDHSLLNNADVMSLAQAVEGGSPVYIMKLSSPKLNASWKQLSINILSTLRGNRAWEEVVPVFLKEIEDQSPDATVSVYVYNPADTLMSLYYARWVNDFTKCPHLEIVVEDASKNNVRILVSLLAWNGNPVLQTPEEIIQHTYGDIWLWMGAMHFHETHLHEEEILAAHNLVTPMLEFKYAPNETPSAKSLTLIEGELTREDFDFEKIKDLSEFLAENQAHLDLLKSVLESHTFGLPGSDLMQSFKMPNE